jgi:hypothetical protein
MCGLWYCQILAPYINWREIKTRPIYATVPILARLLVTITQIQPNSQAPYLTFRYV